MESTLNHNWEIKQGFDTEIAFHCCLQSSSVERFHLSLNLKRITCLSKRMSSSPSSPPTTTTFYGDEIKAGAWVIAASCSWINFCLFTVFRSAGVLYLALVSSLGCSYEEASWPITLASGVACLACLPAGFLSHYLPLKSIVMMGICITSFSISICYFASSVSFIILFLGIIQGN